MKLDCNSVTIPRLLIKLVEVVIYERDKINICLNEKKCLMQSVRSGISLIRGSLVRASSKIKGVVWNEVKKVGV